MPDTWSLRGNYPALYMMLVPVKLYGNCIGKVRFWIFDKPSYSNVEHTNQCTWYYIYIYVSYIYIYTHVYVSVCVCTLERRDEGRSQSAELLCGSIMFNQNAIPLNILNAELQDHITIHHMYISIYHTSYLTYIYIYIHTLIWIHDLFNQQSYRLNAGFGFSMFGGSKVTW